MRDMRQGPVKRSPSWESTLIEMPRTTGAGGFCSGLTSHVHAYSGGTAGADCRGGAGRESVGGRTVWGSGQSGTALHEAQDEFEWQRWLVAELRGYSFVPGIAKHVVARNMITTGQRNRVVAGPGAATPIRLTLSRGLSPPFVER